VGESAHISALLVDQSAPDLPNVGVIVGCPILVSPSVPDILTIEFWSCLTSTKILHVLASTFWGRATKMLGRTLSHTRTFRSRRSFAAIGRRVWEISRWKQRKKHQEQNISRPVTS